jgi:phage terminase large subunit-like protein
MSRLEHLSGADRRKIVALSELELVHRRQSRAGTDWLALARPEQLPPPGSWRTWLVMTGRGWGKSRSAAEAIAAMVRDGNARRIAIVARTADDVRTISIAALQAAVGPGLLYQPANHHRVVFPNGAIGYGFSAAKPDSLRGHEFDVAWLDELAAYPDLAVFDQVQFALRAPGAHLIVTTTPRPLPLLRALRADPTTVVTTGSTRDNAENLDRGSLAFYGQYEGTRLGRQELEGELLEDLDGGLWSPNWIEANRVTTAPELVRIVVAIDPAVGKGKGSDETGIIVAGKSAAGHGYVLADLSGRMTPDRWARVVVAACRTWGADRIIGEVNIAGDLVRTSIEALDPTIPFLAVRASASKLVRAGPIAALYELGRVHHVGDAFVALEDQLCTASLERGSGPDDRLDALVWALADLDLTGSPLDVPGVIPWQYGVWPCACGHGFYWKPNRPCPKCGRPAAATYDAPVSPSGD